MNSIPVVVGNSAAAEAGNSIAVSMVVVVTEAVEIDTESAVLAVVRKGRRQY